MMRKYLFLSLLLCLLNFSCTLKFSFDEIKDNFSTNKKDFLKMLELFSKQDEINSMKRYDESYFSPLFGIFGKSDASYNLKTRNDSRGVVIFIDKESKDNEEEVWRENKNKIRTDTRYSLIEYLKINGISEELFHSIRTFLLKYRLYSISKYSFSNCIILRFAELDGIIYRTADCVEPMYPIAEEIIEIEENIYYFNEY